MGPPWATGDGMLLAEGCRGSLDLHGQRRDEPLPCRRFAGRNVLHPLLRARGGGERQRRAFRGARSISYIVALRKFKEEPTTDFYWVFDDPASYGLHAQRQRARASTTRSCWRPATSSRARTTRTLPKRRGFSDLVATLDTVNDCAVNGAEDPFGNENLPALQLDGPMYAMKILPTPYIAQGGVKVDLSGHVQREDDSLIEGPVRRGRRHRRIGEPRWSRLHDRPHAGGWLWSRRRRNGSSRPGIARFAPQGAGRLRKEAAGVGTLSAAPPRTAADRWRLCGRPTAVARTGPRTTGSATRKRPRQQGRPLLLPAGTRRHKYRHSHPPSSCLEIEYAVGI